MAQRATSGNPSPRKSAACRMQSTSSISAVAAELDVPLVLALQPFDLVVCAENGGSDDGLYYPHSRNA